MVVISHSGELGDEATASVLRPWGLGNIAVMVFFVTSCFGITEAVETVYKDRICDFLVNLRSVDHLSTTLRCHWRRFLCTCGLRQMAKYASSITGSCLRGDLLGAKPPRKLTLDCHSLRVEPSRLGSGLHV